MGLWESNANYENVDKLENGADSIPLKNIDGEPATFEEAITATGFGKYNYMLIALIMFPALSETFEIMSMAYVLPAAQCDLGLTLNDKGVLSAMTFVGMITSALFWGRLSDMVGRKKVITYGYILNGILAIIASLSTNIIVLSIAKFFGGLVINGPFSSFISHLSEFHSTRYRARVQIIRGALISLTNIILPLLAWGFLSTKITFSPFNGITYHSWNIFLFVCAMAPVTTAILYTFIPESPKFLMTAGRYDEALDVFRKVYSINTGNPEHTFKIERLKRETHYGEHNSSSDNKKCFKSALKDGLFQLKPFFQSPHSNRIARVCLNTFLITMSVNLMKLWLPQIFQATSDYQQHNGNGSDICMILTEMRTKNVTNVQTCSVNSSDVTVYVKSMIIGASQMVAYALGGIIVNILGKKTTSISFAVAAGIFSGAVYFAPNSLTVLVLFAIDISVGVVADNVLTTITLELFPTVLRTSALCIHLMAGRFGTVVGNLILPELVHIGCAPPVFFFSALIFGSVIITSFFPSTENNALI